MYPGTNQPVYHGAMAGSDYVTRGAYHQPPALAGNHYANSISHPQVRYASPVRQATLSH